MIISVYKVYKKNAPHIFVLSKPVEIWESSDGFSISNIDSNYVFIELKKIVINRYAPYNFTFISNIIEICQGVQAVEETNYFFEKLMRPLAKIIQINNRLINKKTYNR